MTEVNYIRVSRGVTPIVKEGDVDFGFTDQKGRACGYSWVIYQVTCTLRDPAVQSFGHVLPLGHPLSFLEVRSGPTRNGRHYGASNAPVTANTIEQAEAEAHRRCEQARKRDAKKFNGGSAS